MDLRTFITGTSINVNLTKSSQFILVLSLNHARICS